ncbi:DMT family transporter [Yoonia sp. SDW83-1]|uniref:DMT family transporter n=1 Tax=Yoonia sp. SDW83-1 TaxID=3366945 RepID=UPI00398C3AE1
MSGDRPFLGVLLMLAFCVLAPLGDAVAKLLGGIVALGILLLVRFVMQALILLPLVLLNGQKLTLPRDLLIWTLMRTGLHILGIGLMFTALRYLPLADALAIAFVMPFIMLLLGHFAMGEEVGMPRMMACLVGFIGTLLVIQPNFVEVGYPALLPLGVALVFALFMMLTRKVARDVDPIRLQAISGVQATVMLVPLLLLFPDARGTGAFDFAPSTLWLLLALGVIGTSAHLFMTWSLRFAPASTLAPMQYLEIPFGTAIGWMIFSDLPNGLAAVGICITVGAGLYIIMRERQLSRRPQDATAAE